jgi:flagellar basal body-associated protein FliL
MSDAPENAAPAPAKKSKAGMIIGIVVAVVTLVAGSIAGAVIGPRLLGAAPAKAEAAGEHGAAEEEREAPAHGGAPEKIISVTFAPVVVDYRDQDDRIRHLKVGIDAELPETTPEEEFKLYVPRGREAILTFLRGLTYEEVTDPTRFASIKEELSKRVMEAVGQKRVKRVLIVDFVSQ